MKYLAVFLSSLLAFHAAPAIAEVSSGNANERGCHIVLNNKTPQDVMEAAQAMQCLTTVSVALKIGPLLDRKLRFCSPEGVTVVQSVDVVIKFLDEHPAEADRNFVDSTLRALKLAWPCSVAKRPRR